MIKRILTFFLLKTAILISQTNSNVDNFRIFPSNVTQTEPVVAVHPLNHNLLFVSAVTINTSNGFRSEGIYVSTDGGNSWDGSDVCNGALINNHGGDPGVAIDSGGYLILVHIGSVFPGVYGHYSTNNGLNWSNAFQITSQQPEDKGKTTIDNNPTSPYYNRAYTVWVNYVSPYPVLISFSSNRGISWTAPSAINNPPPARCSGGSVKTGKDGSVYVCWAGVSNIFPFTEDYVGFAVSTNGGANWQVSQNIFDINGINGTLSAKGNIRVNGIPQIDIDKSGGSRDGWLYIITTEKNHPPAGNDPDIILHRSTDNGLTWSNGIRVNQDELNNGKIQYFPSICVDEKGGINIIYYDDRNTSEDSVEVILSRSSDGGNTWTESVISSHRFKPKPIVGGPSNYQGDHVSLLAVGDKLYAFWMDDFSGIYQIWLKIIDLKTSNVEESILTSPKEFELNQNFPNPFNDHTIIRFSLSEKSNVNFAVYNTLGVKIFNQAFNNLEIGSHSINFSAQSLPSGIYFYSLSNEKIVNTKKMIILK